MTHDRKMSVHVMTMLTPEEKQALRMAAASASSTMSSYVRDLIRADLAKHAVTEEQPAAPKRKRPVRKKAARKEVAA